MDKSLRAFMAQLIDYAGLFPPAKLPLDQAFPNYIAYKQTADAWMLSRFIIPAQQLDQLSALLDGQRVALSILGQGGADFLTTLRADMDKVKAFRQRHGDQVQTDFFEVKLPSIDKTVLEQAAQILGDDMNVFYEVPVAELSMLDTMAAYNESHRPVGVKLRCGGEQAAAFPSVEAMAAFLVSCRDHGLKLKATAGLHHPVRHFNESVQTHMHGFLNVFGAALLAHIHRLDAQAIVPILADENVSHFSFTHSYFAWQDFRIEVAAIEKLRQDALISYGSCSFDEPREDLQALHLLEEVAR